MINFETEYDIEWKPNTLREIQYMTGYMTFNSIRIFECRLPKSFHDPYDQHREAAIQEYIEQKFANRLNEVLHT